MRRRVFTVLRVGVASAMLAAATLVLALWLVDRGTTMSRELVVTAPGAKQSSHLFTLLHFGGRIYAAMLTGDGGQPRWDISVGSDRTWSMGFLCYTLIDETLGGFSARSIDESRLAGLSAVRIACVPSWFAVAALASPSIAMGFRIARRRRRVRSTERRCVCGYDLRASPDRCPECGRAAPAASGAAT